jgi:amidase
VTVTDSRRVPLRPTSVVTGRWPGVPTAIKDLNAVAGVPARFGSVVFRDFVPDVSDEVVLRIERAGW